jgi:hypothetical protein
MFGDYLNVFPKKFRTCFSIRIIINVENEKSRGDEIQL